MGACCGKDSMPIVEEVITNPVACSPTSAVPFDYIHNGSSAMMNDSIIGRRAYAPERSFTPRELDAATVASNTTMRSALSFITNGNQDVSYDYVGQFVERIRNRHADPLEGSFASGFGAPSVGSARVGKELEGLSDNRTKLARLVELEESFRVEIVAACRMNVMLFSLAAQRMVPTMRIRKNAGSQLVTVTGKKLPRKKQPAKATACAPVLVIHASDVQIEFNETDKLDQTAGELAVGVGDQLDQTVRGVSEEEERQPMYSPELGRTPTGGDFASRLPSLELQPAASSVVEHYEMLALTAREVSISGDVKGLVVTESWDFLSLPHTTNLLNSGAAFYRFVSKPCDQLDASSLEILDMFANVSSFANETVENNVPYLNCRDRADLSKYVVILAKAMYVLPGVRLATINKELLASLDYQRNCQAGETRFHDDVTTPFTFRQTKTIVKFLFSLVIQMKVSEITDPEALNRFKQFDGLIPAKVILLERTKKNSAKVDSTAKCKSLLLYYPINDGVLVSHATIVLNTSLPTMVSKILHTFGGQGAKENADAVRNTRRYLIHRFGDSREGFSTF